MPIYAYILKWLSLKAYQTHHIPFSEEFLSSTFHVGGLVDNYLMLWPLEII